MRIAVSYTIFAALATIANIGSQDVFVRIYGGVYSLALSVLVGTAVGLVVKYILDKKFIFRFRVKSAVHDTQVFFLYTVTGIFTTAIFWGFEFGFDYLFQTKALRYAGGIIGLAIGYFIKYRLDKRYVFLGPIGLVLTGPNRV